jgi:hypothetical protein
MGTVRLERMRLRYAGYLAWWRARGHLPRWGDAPLRVLTLTTTTRRMEALRKASTPRVGETRLFWHALLEHVSLTEPERFLASTWTTSESSTPQPLFIKP